MRREGFDLATIAECFGLTRARVSHIVAEQQPTPIALRSREFEERAFALLPQVDSLRRDTAEENVFRNSPGFSSGL